MKTTIRTGWMVCLAVTLMLLLAQSSKAAGVGRRFSVTSALGLSTNQSAQVFVPDYFVPPADGRIVLVFHMHGGAGTAEDQVYKARANAVLFNIQLNGLSGVYQSYFGDTTRFPTITNLVINVLRTNNVVADPKIGKLIVTSFSAGYAGIRELLKSPANYQRINALMLADSLHSNSDEPTRGVQMQNFLQFAKDARDLKKIFLLTHSSIVTSGYESTTETADYLVGGIGSSWTPSSTVDSLGTQYRICDAGHFEVRGYLPAGSSDHSLQFRGMDLMMKRAMQILATTAEVEPPFIVAQPERQTVKQGASATFSVLSSGAAPLFFQWSFNNTAIAGATNAALTLTNLQPFAQGEYRVTVSNAYGTVTSSPASLMVNTKSYPVLFSDTFDTSTATNWNLFWGADNNVADYTVQWAFDYSSHPYTVFGETDLIPPAPNSDGTTRGVRFSVNNNDTLAYNSGVNIYSAHQSFSSNYALKFDMWIHYPGGPGGAGAAGSTEMALCGINHLGTQANWMAASAPSTDGLWFAVAGEGGTTRDYRAYQGNPGGTQSELIGPAASGLAEANNTGTFFQNLFPGSQFETSGAPGKRWVEVELSQSNNVITWKMDGTIVAQRTNTSSFSSGKVMLGFMDPFTSIASPSADAFVLFDNVRVEDLTNPIDAPAIGNAPQHHAVRPGTNIMFSANASGSEPLTYQWFFNGTAVFAGTNSSYTKLNLQAADSGTYSVLVSNIAGSVYSPITFLTVTNSLPTFAMPAISPEGSLVIDLSGAPGSTFVIETSTNLLQWETVTNAHRPDGILRFDGGTITNRSQQFFRAFSE